MAGLNIQYARRLKPWMIFALLLAMANSAWAGAKPAGWVLSYEGKSSNAFIWDKRAKGLIKNSVPPKIADELLSALGGPPDPVVVVKQRYVSVSACVAHACMVKGMFWFDSQEGVGIGVYLDEDSLTLASSGLRPEEVPAIARKAITDWLSDVEVQPKQAQYLAPNGDLSPIAPTQFIRPTYRATPEGPSFDCRKAGTAIERSICSDAQLAKQDLELAALFNEIRRGNDTVGARDELRSFQLDWLKDRDASCKKSAAMATCLHEQYRQQHDRLMHWTPKH
ncbi:lysozyme inhibitor LprI family protein [Pseudoduganella violacea]|uniref:Uncharacterized protein YecT (DUF1311 family) n=1 Tax=Pseudoduganella violacea TaxID=1715466 RepID=A0A7W5BDL5_9BURK|nr:lysozyme inhibitor LprI family protein [Pseudoduganella violacea]MBB3121198.1 uncharacterized protein YecT (DUF1311 family) [Pseudoduganella violacea]